MSMSSVEKYTGGWERGDEQEVELMQSLAEQSGSGLEIVGFLIYLLEHTKNIDFREYILARRVIGFMSRLNIKACSTAATTCCRRIAYNLELASDQLHRIVNLASLEKPQARFIHYDLGAGAVARFKHRIVFWRDH